MLLRSLEKENERLEQELEGIEHQIRETQKVRGARCCWV